MSKKTVKEAVGIFHDRASLDQVIDELEVREFGRDNISVLGSKKAIKEHFGEQYVAPEDAEHDPEAPRQAPVRAEERALGKVALVGGGAYVGAVAALVAANAAISIPAIVTAAALGGGGGGLMAGVLGERFDESFEEQIDKGGIVLWVITEDQDEEKLACEILEKHGAGNVHVHELKAA